MGVEEVGTKQGLCTNRFIRGKKGSAVLVEAQVTGLCRQERCKYYEGRVLTRVTSH